MSVSTCSYADLDDSLLLDLPLIFGAMTLRRDVWSARGHYGAFRGSWSFHPQALYSPNPCDAAPVLSLVAKSGAGVCLAYVRTRGVLAGGTRPYTVRSPPLHDYPNVDG